MRLVLPRLDQSQSAELAQGIRKSSLPDRQRLAELAELRAVGILADSEAMQVDEAIRAGEIREPTDPRQDTMFTRSEWAEEKLPEVESTGWPFPEDEDYVRDLLRPVAEAEQADAQQRAGSLARQLESLGAVLRRDEARTERWIGVALGWCRRAIEELRVSVERPDGDEPHEKLTSTVWLEMLEKDAGSCRADGGRPHAQ